MSTQDAAPAETAVPPAPEEMHQLALRVAVLGVRADDAVTAYQVARSTAAPRFALARKLGIKQQAVMLPGGIEAGTLAIKQGARTVTVDEAELMLLVLGGAPSEVEDYVTGAALLDPSAAELLAEHCPDLVELRIKEGALADDRAVKVFAEHAPELVERRIRPAYRAGLQQQIEGQDGRVADPATGELVKVAEITQHDPAGDFTHTGKAKFAERVREALEAGRLKLTETGDIVEAGLEGGEPG